MSATCQSEFIFMGKGDESFLENYSYEYSGGGQLFMALEILNNASEAEDIGEALFANIKQKFFENMGTQPFERFEEALKAANQTLETLKEEKVSRFIGSVNVAVAVVEGNALFITTAGDAEVYLVRKRFVSVVSEGLAEDGKKDTFANIANGTLQDGDRVVLSSSRLLRYVTKQELGRIMSEGASIGSALAELQDFIMTEILGRAAVVGLSFSDMQEQEEGGAMGGLFEEESGEGRVAAVKLLVGRALGFLRRIMPSSLPSLPSLASLKPSIMPRPQKFNGLSRERILVIAIALLVVLVSGVFWLRTRGNQRRAIAEQQAKLNHARELVADAATVGQFDKPKASELLSNAEQQALEVLNSRYLRSDAVKMLDDIRANRDSLDDVRRVAAPTLLADFSEKRSSVSSLGLLALKDKLYGFEYNALYEMVLDALQEPLPISDVESVILGTDYPENNALLFETRSGKMIQFKDSHFSFVSTKDGIWRKGVDMKSYNNRLYILDPERNQIWRYTQTRDGFEAAEAYNQDADLKTSISLSIDSGVYVLNADGSIAYLYQGKKQDYPVRRPPLDSVVNPTKIFTGVDHGFLYVLEPSKQRVVVYRKDLKNGGAQYHTQYVFEKTGVLRDLLVTDNRLYVMDEKKVYFVNLSGL